MKMPLFVALTALLVAFPPLLLGGDNPAAQQLLTTAMQQANLFSTQAGSFQLDVDFVAQMKVPVQGHLTLKREGKDHWWRKITMADFGQIEIRNGDVLYIRRNVGFAPMQVRELLSLLAFAESPEGMVAKKQKERVDNGVSVTCLQVERNTFKRKTELCVNSSNHEILSEEWQELPDERRREQYADYFDFAGYRYPRQLQLFVNGIKMITAKVDDLAAAPFDESLLVPPKGAIERRQCDDMKSAIAVKAPDPMYPTSARENKVMGDTTVAMTVLADGSVTDIQLVGSAARSMDEATMQTLKSWRFKPAMCGTEPVVTDIEVVVSFRLR